MAKAKAAVERVRSKTMFCVGARTINAAEVFPADDQLVLARPEQFEPVPDEGDGS